MRFTLRSITAFFALIAMLSTFAFSQEKPMLEQIESGVLQLLQQKIILPARAIERQKSGAGGTGSKTLSMPSIGVAIEAGKLTPMNAGKTVFKNDISLFVYLDFNSLRDEEALRKGIYPILLSTMSFLSGQTLGLDIKPLVPVQFQNTTDQADIDQLKMNFMIEFTTAYQFDKLEDEAASTLLRTGIDYLLKPGDDEADMQGRVGNDFPI